jgi:hypothetical protein
MLLRMDGDAAGALRAVEVVPLDLGGRGVPFLGLHIGPALDRA